VGWVVTPSRCTRRVACSMTKNAYKRRRLMVSRWNRSQARIDVPVRGGSAPSSALPAAVRGRCRPDAGWSRQLRRRSDSRGRRARCGC
jgi:hypothetical protein